ncbi:MAG: transcription elongation factor GreA [Fibrobacteres bacterium]|nr:transcription elongation factor GreA [Fibrobacterota bacterium]
MDLHHMTRDGYEKLQEKLNHMMTDKRRQIAKDMEHARSFGDLSENAEYDAAKEKLDHNERDIKELTERLATARILDDSKIAKDKAFIGATVKLRDHIDDEEIVYTLVSALEANIDENKISVQSPIGKAMLGLGVKDVVSIKAPNGKTLKYTILEISR